LHQGIPDPVHCCNKKHYARLNSLVYTGVEWGLVQAMGILRSTRVATAVPTEIMTIDKATNGEEVSKPVSVQIARVKPGFTAFII
jgi:hypothetical protein